MSKPNKYDFVIIGGGFYGCMIALFLSRLSKKVLILEQESDVLKRASYHNQARIHNGYHYPRSFLTSLRSHANFLRFSDDFKKAVCGEYPLVYAIASTFSKTTSSQFIKFCQQVGSKLTAAPDSIKKLFDAHLIEDVFMVDEYIFNIGILKKMIKRLIKKAGVKVKYDSRVVRVESAKNKNVIIILENGGLVLGKSVFNCSYSGINVLLKNSNLSLLPLKYEFTEMPLIKVPDPLKKIGITIMDGPFFGVMPFPDKNLHTIHHVRYTPHLSWTDEDSIEEVNLKKLKNKSKFLFMKKDAQRYIPMLKDSKRRGSLYEIRTVLIQMEQSDGRPILYRRHHGIENFHVVLGGKLDNVYDIIEEIRKDLTISRRSFERQKTSFLGN